MPILLICEAVESWRDRGINYFSSKRTTTGVCCEQQGRAGGQETSSSFFFSLLVALTPPGSDLLKLSTIKLDLLLLKGPIKPD